MMVLPSKENRERYSKLENWLRYDATLEKHYLDSSAPEDIKRLYSEHVKANKLEDFWVL